MLVSVFRNMVKHFDRFLPDLLVVLTDSRVHACVQTMNKVVVQLIGPKEALSLAEIREHFEQFGVVSSASASSVCGHQFFFVGFADAKAATAAVQNKRQTIGDQSVFCKLCASSPAASAPVQRVQQTAATPAVASPSGAVGSQEKKLRTEPQTSKPSSQRYVRPTASFLSHPRCVCNAGAVC